jgi:hypothetical protein
MRIRLLKKLRSSSFVHIRNCDRILMKNFCRMEVLLVSHICQIFKKLQLRYFGILNSAF